MRRIPAPLSREAVSPVRAAGHDADDNGGVGVSDGQTGTATKTRTRSKKPSQYKVLMLNDDYLSLIHI